MDNENLNFNLKYLFPKTNKTKYLKTDYEGIYSISRPDDAKHITKLIKKKILLLGLRNNDIDIDIDINNTTKIHNYGEINLIDLTITDATAGIGGNTISFCKDFKSVIAIEINKNRFEYLKNNLKIYNLTNYVAINGDMMEMIQKTEQDIIFIDPPWGGKSYVEHENLDIYIGNIEISKISKDLLDNDNCKLVVLKLPYNYNIDNTVIMKKEKYEITRCLIRTKILLLLINKI
jgi:16S rRNA G966 N2-methylase RsmD